MEQRSQHGLKQVFCNHYTGSGAKAHYSDIYLNRVTNDRLLHEIVDDEIKHSCLKKAASMSITL